MQERVGEIVRIGEDYYFVITNGAMYLTRNYHEAGRTFTHQGVVRKVENLEEAVAEVRKRTGYQ